MRLLAHSQTPKLWLAMLVLITLSLGMTGCSDWVYRQDIQQGNVLDDEDLTQLQLGMTKRQVMVLLGSPSVSSPFHADRWDYVNTYASRGEAFVSRTLTLVFVNNALASIEGNYLDQDSETARTLKALQSAESQLEEAELIDPN